MASMNYFDSDMYNSTNTVVHFDGKEGNSHLCLLARSHTTLWCRLWSIFQLAKFEQTITQHVLLWQESLIDGTDVTIILCLHILIAHHIFICFWICWLFWVNIDVWNTDKCKWFNFVILSPGFNVCTMHGLRRFCHLKINRSFVYKANEGHHFRSCFLFYL